MSLRACSCACSSSGALALAPTVESPIDPAVKSIVCALWQIWSWIRPYSSRRRGANTPINHQTKQRIQRTTHEIQRTNNADSAHYT